MDLRESLYEDPGATVDDLTEAVTMLEDADQPRGACSVARTHSPLLLSAIATTRQARRPRRRRRELRLRRGGRDDVRGRVRRI